MGAAGGAATFADAPAAADGGGRLHYRLAGAADQCGAADVHDALQEVENINPAKFVRLRY